MEGCSTDVEIKWLLIQMDKRTTGESQSDLDLKEAFRLPGANESVSDENKRRLANGQQ